MGAMDSWKHESVFVDFIAESSTFPTAPSSPGPEHKTSQPGKDDLEAYQRTLEQIQKVESHLRTKNLETTQIQNLHSFLKGSRKISPTLPIAQQFERLRSLRDWLFWMPVAYLQNYQCSADSLVAISHLYTVAILMERMFPEIGSAYFGSLSLMPIEEIARRLLSICISSGADDSEALKLMEFPIDVVSEFRSRMGWVQPERTQSFPRFDPPNFPSFEDLSGYEHNDSYVYANPAFSYSHEQMPMLNSSGPPPHSPVMPLSLASFNTQPYLSIPSPMYGGSHSPASSTFEGSIAYSDGEDYSPFDMSGMPAAHSPVFNAHSPVFNEGHSFHGGFVSPTQTLWI